MALIALDIDGTLIDTTPSFTRIVKELSGASDDEIARFRDTGGFNDDWELTRACTAWIAAGRPEVFVGLVDVHDLLRRVGQHFDPGDMSAPCLELYRGGYWKNERVLVDGVLLQALARRHRVVACTGRDLWELEKAELLLGFTFLERTTMEDRKKPHPDALMRLVQHTDDVVVLFGDTAADRMCVENARAWCAQTDAHRHRELHFVHVTHTKPARALLLALSEGAPLDEIISL